MPFPFLMATVPQHTKPVGVHMPQFGNQYLGAMKPKIIPAPAVEKQYILTRKSSVYCSYCVFCSLFIVILIINKNAIISNDIIIIIIIIIIIMIMMIIHTPVFSQVSITFYRPLETTINIIPCYS